VTLDLWNLIYVLIAFIGFSAGAAKLLLSQFEKRQSERHSSILQQLQAHFAEEKLTVEKLSKLERDFLEWRGELPLNYVRRDDFIRTQSTIETKIDALALRIENALLKRGTEK